MGAMIFCVILGILFLIACMFGVVALYFMLKSWAWDELDIELPPKKKTKESYWETLKDSVIPSYVCRECGYQSDEKFWHCPWCGRYMGNHRD